MKKNLTEMVFILDKSGSMADLTKDTIGGFNSLIRKQRGEEGEAIVSAVLFSDSSEVLYDRVPLDKITPMTDKDYVPAGCTALLDAVGDAVKHIGNIHKYAREEDVPEKTIFVITTDGMENASRRYSYKEVKQLISRQQEKYGWEFIFLGANIDAAAAAGDLGIKAANAVNYTSDSMGTEAMYCSAACAVTSLRKTGKLCEDWTEEIRKDEKKRGLRRR